ncbi:MAG TPA: HEAT repeat domain-containing protein [Pirellulaceae bacterium]|nr:HEAT repeat domain-containing protein [Pirellulaceae bacterium]
MKRRVLLVPICIVLLLLVAATILDPNGRLIGIARGEAFFQGQPTSYWVSLLEEEVGSGELKSSTIKTFDLDPRAVPVLKQCLDFQSPDVRWAATRLLQHCGSYREQVSTFRSLLDDPVTRVRVEAICGLGNLRREALGALAQLEELAYSDDDQITLAARYALWSIDQSTAMRAEGWQDHEFPTFGFTARFPGNVRTDSRKAQRVDSDLHEFWTSLGPSRFTIVLTFVLPDVSTTVAERYDLAPIWAVENLGGTIDTSEEITLGPYVGRDIRIITDGGFILRTRLFIIKDRVYQAQAAYKPGLLHPDAVEHFLNSFRTIERRAES